MVAPGQMHGNFLPSPTQIACLLSKGSTVVPDPIEGAAHTFFSPAAFGWPQVWLERAGAALASRHVAVRELYEKARYFNLQNLRKKQQEANGVLDKSTIQMVLGK